MSRAAHLWLSVHISWITPIPQHAKYTPSTVLGQQVPSIPALTDHFLIAVHHRTPKATLPRQHFDSANSNAVPWVSGTQKEPFPVHCGRARKVGAPQAHLMQCTCPLDHREPSLLSLDPSLAITTYDPMFSHHDGWNSKFTPTTGTTRS